MIGSEGGRKWVMWGLIGCWPLGDAGGDWQWGHSVWSACSFRIIPGNRDSLLYRALGKRAPAKLAYCNTNTMGMKQTVEVLISEITMCQSPEEKEQHNKREIESVSEEALISILIVKRISIVRYFTACQNPLGEIIFFSVMFVRELASCATSRNSVQLVTRHRKSKKKALLSGRGLVGGGSCWSGARGWKSCRFITLTLPWPRVYCGEAELTPPTRPCRNPGVPPGGAVAENEGGGGGTGERPQL